MTQMNGNANLDITIVKIAFALSRHAKANYFFTFAWHRRTNLQMHVVKDPISKLVLKKSQHYWVFMSYNYYYY